MRAANLGVYNNAAGRIEVVIDCGGDSAEKLSYASKSFVELAHILFRHATLIKQDERNFEDGGSDREGLRSSHIAEG